MKSIYNMWTQQALSVRVFTSTAQIDKTLILINKTDEMPVWNDQNMS